MKFERPLNYWEILIRQNSGTAEEICRRRWDFIKETRAKKVLDYGSGPGWFRAFAPEGIDVETYDLNPWPQTGMTKGKKYDLITFWDVLEHISDFTPLEDLFARTKYVAVTVPIIPPDLIGTDLDTKLLFKWRHFKPFEHCIYFSIASLLIFFESYGFKFIKAEYCECPPRQDILSAVFKKRKDRVHQRRV